MPWARLAEYLADYDGKSCVDCFAPMTRDGIREWVRYQDIDLDAGVFVDLGAAFEKTGGVEIGDVGKATARLMKQRDLVDFGVEWMEEHRAQGSTASGHA